MRSAPPIEAVGLSLQYDNVPVPVLDGLNLVVHPGQTVAIVGPSGAGKTTLLSVLGGLAEPDHGTVSIGGMLVGVGTQDVLCQQVGWVFQTTNVIGRLSARENVELGLYGLGITGDRAQSIAAEWLHRVGLEGGLMAQKAHRLSGGERQRLCIARALARQPTVLLCDEPTGQLDRATAADVGQLLLATDRDSAVVIATHDETLARGCDRVIEIIDGRLDERG